MVSAMDSLKLGFDLEALLMLLDSCGRTELVSELFLKSLIEWRAKANVLDDVALWAEAASKSASYFALHRGSTERCCS